jgi:hypothetical protein
MSRPVKIVCDGCGRQKEATNNWWTVQVNKAPGLGFSIIPGTIPDPDELADYLDFCGRECALKFISEQMGKHGEETA